MVKATDDPGAAYYLVNTPACHHNRFHGQPFWVSEYGGSFWNPEELGR